MLSRAALAGIAGYQRWVSPRKGYGCAHRLLHGGDGCSGFAKNAIRDRGVIPALPGIRVRLAACRDAAVTLRRGRRRKEEGRRDRWYDGCDCGCSAIDCGPRAGWGGCGRGGGDATPDCDCAPDCCGF